MKIAVYSPYLDSFGGGERYILSIAEIFSRNHDLDLLLDKNLESRDPVKLKEDLGKLFNLNLSKVNLVSAPIGVGSSFFSRLIFFKKYDILFYLSDGSIFYSTAKKSFLHFQVPFAKLPQGLTTRIKLSSWNGAIYNSSFTRSEIEKSWKIKGEVIYPPVDTQNIIPLKKKNQIISVGRFFGYLKTKKQKEMVESFKEITKSLEDWSFHLVGSIASEDDQKYLDQLKEVAAGFPIYFYPNLPFIDLARMYGESKIYWHAAGFGENNPEKMEHFGITTVEAMASGCVPIVINLGGQKEIVEEGVSGFLWDDLAELKRKTIKLVSDQDLLKTISKESISRSQMFSKTRFQQQFEELINEK